MPAAPKKDSGDEIIAVEAVETMPRGRKAVIDPELVEVFVNLQPGQAVRLAGRFGSVPKEQRAGVSAVIRKHWRAGRSDDCRIDYSRDGVPQVRARQ